MAWHFHPIGPRRRWSISVAASFLASFKIWNMATVGGNLCMSLPAGPMISLTAALDGVCMIWTTEGGERRVAIFDFIFGPQRNALKPGELLRAIDLPIASLRRRTAFRQISLSPLGRSGALLIGTLSPDDGAFALTVTASTPRPVRLSFARLPSREALRDKLEAEIPPQGYYNDVHGAPAWRRQVTLAIRRRDSRRVRRQRRGRRMSFLVNGKLMTPSRGPASACAPFCASSAGSA